ncbi:hypothetical protein [Pseudactinotalea terrae]|uniref:hypothetical protein n=1 Tax=Pseudactinotalea terrae TaxID=1743262 RepID=UPI0012E0FDE4|nr:hypothetical protein [Pseudactinotalea terrae]
MSVSNRNRVQPGIREGGQFATETRAETDVSLAAAGDCDLCDRVTAPGRDLCAGCEETQRDRTEGKVNQVQAPTDADRLARMTPAEVDTELNEAMHAAATAQRKLEYALSSADRATGLPPRRWNEPPYGREQIVEALQTRIESPDSADWQVRIARRSLDDIAAGDAAVQVHRAEIAAYDAEWNRRGRWSRAFLVTGGDGHVHSSMGCSTCNRGQRPTQFQFMTEFSGNDEADIVTAAGWRACTVCYPSAPVGSPRSLPTSMWSKEDLDKQQAKAEREAKKAARNAEKIAKGLTADGSPMEVRWTARNAPGWDRDPETGKRVHAYRDRSERAEFATERSAVQWYLFEHVSSGAETHADQAPAYEAIEQALAAKHGKTVEQIRTELAAKVAAKRRRESR